MQLPQQLSDGMKSIKNRLSRGNDEAPNVSLSPAMVVPASPRKIIFHLVRHAQAKHDDMSNYLYEEERLSWTDPKLTKLGEQQATTLCKNFSRMPFITTLISSPSRRSIQTAIHAFAPAIKEGLDIQVSPFFKEFTSFNCNQPLLIGMLQEKFKKKDCIDWKRLMEEPDYWKSGWPLLEFQFNLEVHAEFCRQILYDIGKKVIEAGAVNTEGNAEIAVVGHVIALNCLMGNIAYTQRKSRPWEHTEYRSFQFIPSHLLAGSNIKPHNAYEEIMHDGTAHLPTFIPRSSKSLKPEHGGLEKGHAGPELPFRIRPAAPPIPKESTNYISLIKSIEFDSCDGRVLITSAESADTLGVSAGTGREGGNVVFAFDQGVFPVADRPVRVIRPRSELVRMAHNSDRDGWKEGVVTGMTEVEEEVASGDASSCGDSIRAPSDLYD